MAKITLGQSGGGGGGGTTPSGSANQVYATPNGSGGTATLRAVVEADLPAVGGLITTAQLFGGTTLANQSVVATANKINVMLFRLERAITINNIAFAISTNETATVDVGIYSTAGVLLANLGATSVSGSAKAFSGTPTQGSVTLEPGAYYFAQTCSISTGFCVSHEAFIVNSTLIGALGTFVLAGVAANSASAGALTGVSLGTVTNSSSVQYPLFTAFIN